MTINIPAGTYYLNQSILMSNNMTISGAGPSTIIQLPASPNGIAAFTSYGGTNMTVENLVMDGGIPRGAFLLCCGGNSNPYNSTGVNMYSTSSAETNVTLSNLEIRNFRLGLFLGTVNGLYISNLYMHDNNIVSGFAHNAYLVSCDNVTITHSRFNDAHTGDGLHIDFGGVNTTIIKSEFTGNNGLGILSQQNVNVTMSSTRTDFNTNEGIQVDAAGLNLLTNEGSYNGSYGFNIPDTLDGNGYLNGYWGYGDGGDIGYFYEASIANITGDGYPTSPNFYEAEQADGVLGVTDTADWTTAYSGFSGVGAVDFNANHITVPGQLSFSHVGAVTAGSYPMTIRYSNGTGSTQTMSLTVNGVAQSALSFPATTNNSTWSTVTFSAPLQVGNNVVQIGVVGSAAPEIDYLQVSASSSGPAPAAPTGVTATAVDPYTVTLNWQASPIAATYNVYQNGRVMAVNVVATTYTDKKIYFGNSTVTYTVQAVNQYGASAGSSVTVTTPIDSPAGFQNASGSGGGNYFQWMSANGAASYNLKRSAVSGGPYVTVASIPNTTNLTSGNYEQSGQDATATPGTTFYYVVTAVDGNGNESATKTYELAATAPYPGLTLSVSPNTPNIALGQNVTVTLAITPLYGFSGTVNIAVTGLPAGVTASIGAGSNYSYPVTLTAASNATLGSATLTITATGAGGTPTASTTVSLQVATQLITFNAIPPQVVGTSLTLTATASSGLPVSYTAVPNGNCSVSGSVVTFLNTGNCGIVASQAGNGSNYAAAPTVGQIIVVNSTPSGQTISFPAIPTQPVGGTLALVATATSALPVSFASSTTSVCTVSGTTASLLTSGTCTITASQAGNASYNAATPVTQSFNVGNLTAQTITFGTIAAQTLGTPLTLSATASSGLQVVYTSSTPSVCTVSGTTATFVAAGTCTIVASQGGNGTYSVAASVTQSFAVSLEAQTITFGAIPSQAVGTSLTVSATASSGLPVSFSVIPNGNCSVSGNVVTFLNTGNCGVVASQPGNSVYAAAAVVGQIIVVTNQSAAPQTITFPPIGAQAVGGTLTLSATASSGLPVSYASSTTSVCTVSGSTASLVGSGTCTITASQAGNAGYAAAPSVMQSFSVGVQAQTITFPAIAAQTAGGTVTLSASASSGLAVTFASTTPSVCTVSGTTASLVGSGTCTITASQAGSGTYSAASVSQSFNVNAQTQTITFPAIAAQTAGGTVTLSASASSGLAVTFASTTPSVCTVSGTTASLVGSGTCTITASQAGSGTYSAASVSQTFSVNAATQTITFPAIAAQTAGGTVTLSASASSGLAVTFASTTPSVCTVSGTTASLVGSGTCTITASQAGSGTYSAASVSQSFNVNAQTQTIAFGAIPAQTVGTTLTVSAAASSGLPVSFTVVPNGNCSVSGNVVTFLNVGNCGVIASQAGNSIYAAAAAVGQIIVVNNLTQQTITFPAIATQTVGTTASLSATATSGLAVGFASSTTGVCTVSGTTASFVTSGTCTIVASQPGNGTYSAAPSVTQSFSVVGKAQTISFPAIAAQTAGTTAALSATASSGLTVAFASSTVSVCTVSGTTASFVTSGTCTIVASQAGSSIYAAAPNVTQNISVGGEAQSISFPAIASPTAGTTATLSATASSGLTVAFASSTSSVCTVSGTTASFIASGTCTILASQAGSSIYAAAPNVTQNISVVGQAQTISFPAIATQTAGTTLSLSATASSGLTVAFASSTTSVCTVSGTTASFATAGTCTIVASQAGSSTYAAATPVSQSFTVSAAALKSQTITFNAIAAQTVGTSLTLTATASSGLAVTYTVVPNGNCSVSGNLVTFLNAGNCGVIAAQAGNSTYAAATSVGQIIVVNNPTAQTITFPTIAAQTVGATVALGATASSGLAVSYASSTTSVCTVSGSTASMVAAGTCTITASQAGNSTFAAATSVSQSFTVNASLKSQTITFPTIATQTAGSTVTLGATASSGLAVSYASSTTSVCTVSGGTATLVASGTCTIVASQAGSSAYAAAASVTQSFTVNGESQTITFNAIAAQTVGTSLTVSATASSGLPVSFSIVQNGNCSISGAVVTFLNTGNCGVIASQAGNGTYAAAPAVGQVIVVNAAIPSFTLSLSSTSVTVAPGGSGTNTITVKDAGGFTGSVTFAVSGLPTGVTSTLSAASSTTGSTLTLKAASTTKAGTYTVTVKGTSGSLTASVTFSLVIS